MTAEPDEFREVLGHFATGVTVTTVRAEGPGGPILHGMTANAFASLSLDPPLVLVCVDRATGMHDLITQAEGFAVTILTRQQEGLARHFASPRRPEGVEQFNGVAWQPGPASGAPVLHDGLAYVDCSRYGLVDGGDHTIVVGRADAVRVLRDDGEPLLFYQARYRSLGE